MTTSKTRGGAAAAVAAAIIAAVFAVEGGYVNNPDDPGGATNHGVTEQVARADGYTGHMRNLPRQRAEQIIDLNYIERPGYTPFLDIAPAIAEELIDTAYNAGPGRSSRWLQTALNSLNRNGRDYPDLVVDGRVGPATIAAYQTLAERRGRVKACEMVLKLLDGQQAAHYLSLRHLETFMVGWTDTRLGNVSTERC